MSGVSPQRRRLELAGKDPGPVDQAMLGGSLDAAAAHDGSARVRLRFLPDGAEVRVPSGTPVFDAASWNGIAIDSTCGGHGTCKKCRVRIVSGEVPVGPLDPRAFSPDELREGWRLACRASARGDLVVEVPPLQTRPKAALAGVGRHVILRPAVQKRHLVLAEPSMEDQRSDLQRVLDALDDLEPETSIEVLRSLGSVLRASEFRRHRSGGRSGADRTRARRYDRATVRDRVRPRHDDGGRHAPGPRKRPAGSGAVDAEPPAAVRRRRDHAHLGDDDGSGRAGVAANARTRDARRVGVRGLRRG